MNGFFLVDKPKAKTSSNVVLNIKKRLNLKKCGHNGTLDPNTTGLMVVGCNEYASDRRHCRGGRYRRICRLVTLKNKETACLGSAILAAVGVGRFESVEEAAKLIELDRAYESKGIDYSECYERYQAYDRLLNN